MHLEGVPQMMVKPQHLFGTDGLININNHVII